MAVSILDIDDFESNDFNIIAIHTSLADYTLAYLINKHCQITLTKQPIPLTLSKFDINTHFDFFTYQDEAAQMTWSLIANKSLVATGHYHFLEYPLAANPIFSEIVLIPECETVDFFLKIEDSITPHQVNQLMNTLQSINHINAIYQINNDTLVSINNLLF